MNMFSEYTNLINQLITFIITIIHVFVSHRKFEREQWSRARPPSQRQLDNLRINGAGHGKPNLLEWFRNMVLAN